MCLLVPAVFMFKKGLCGLSSHLLNTVYFLHVDLGFDCRVRCRFKCTCRVFVM